MALRFDDLGGVQGLISEYNALEQQIVDAVKNNTISNEDGLNKAVELSGMLDGIAVLKGKYNLVNVDISVKRATVTAMIIAFVSRMTMESMKS